MITPRQLPPWPSGVTLNGYWWPKDKPALRYPGQLVVDEVGILLIVTAPPVGQEVFELGRTSTIHGIVDGPDGPQLVTLWDRSGHYLAHASNGTDHARKYTFAILGSHVEDYESARFGYSVVSFHDLGEWSRIQDTVSEGVCEEGLPQHTVTVLNAPYRDIFGEDFIVTVSLEYPSRLETNERFPDGAIIHHQGGDSRVVFVVQPPAPAAFHELLLQDFQALLTFCYQSGAPVLGRWIGTDSNHLDALLRVDAFRERYVQSLGRFQMIVALDNFSFGELVEKWWATLDEDFPAPQVLTTYLHLRRGLLEQSTASVLAATESLHTRVGPSKQRFPEAEIAVNKSIIQKAFAGKPLAPFRQFLYEKLQENRPTLDTRLRELIDAIGPRRMETLEIETSEWTQLFMRVRNKLAHTGAHVLRRSDPSEELEVINAQARAVLTLLLLTRMNYDEKAIDRAAEVLSKFPHRSW